ncbi:MAG: hypothetical protein DHS20C15_15320 [Planctomycetota bacterium]|nr:MAG: hypothetical protein DHS20C15_15320 [Planctomycetota bacterium]
MSSEQASGHEPEPAPAGASAARPWPLRVALALVPLLLLVGGVELAFVVLDVGAPPSALPLSRGFDPDAPYLVPDPEVPGGWRTQLFGDGGADQRIPPKCDDVARVILLGGSNVQFFPEMLLRRRLEELLNASGDAREVEVINLGREGYASERVSILMRQARVLRPDVFVLYSGHNEFIERGFAMELEGLAERDVFASVRNTLANTRLFRVLASARRSLPSAPEAIDPASQAFAGIAREQTERYFDAYEQNLRRMVALAAEADVPLLLCTVVSNMLSPPYESSPDPALSEAQRARAATLRGEVLQAIPERFREHLRPPTRLWARAWYTGEQAADHAPQLRTLLGPLGFTAAMGGNTKSASVNGAHWPDPRAWDDDVVQVIASIERFQARELSDVERSNLEAARALSEELFELDPDNPNALFDRGMLLWLSGDGRAAAEAFALAAARDRAPRSGNDSTNGRVRRVAGEHPEVSFFDVDALFRERHPDGLIGYEATMDHCHLQPGARAILMADFAERLLPMLAP